MELINTSSLIIPTKLLRHKIFIHFELVGVTKQNKKETNIDFKREREKYGFFCIIVIGSMKLAHLRPHMSLSSSNDDNMAQKMSSF